MMNCWAARMAAVVMAGLASPALAQQSSCGPEFSQSGPDAAAYGEGRGYPLGTVATRYRQPFIVATFTSYQKLLPVLPIAAGSTASPLRRSCAPLAVSYRHDGVARTLDDYLARHPATGFLVLKGDTILTERYRYGRRDTDVFQSASMAKTIMAMLTGVAVADGKIRSLDDHASAYVPALKGSAYGETPVRALLRMSSGVAFSEDYLGQDDNTKLNTALRRKDSPGMAALLAGYSKRDAAAGSRFRYASSESMVLGLVLEAATGARLADYASEKLWRPMGAEADASWGTDPQGDGNGACCFNARLRDYARLGRLLANDGGGVIPAAWVREATTAPANSPFSPRTATPFYGYGYQTWLLPPPGRMFALLGVFGQTIFVDPASKLVLVHTAARELVSLWYALVSDHGRR